MRHELVRAGACPACVCQQMRIGACPSAASDVLVVQVTKSLSLAGGLLFTQLHARNTGDGRGRYRPFAPESAFCASFLGPERFVQVCAGSLSIPCLKTMIVRSMSWDRICAITIIRCSSCSLQPCISWPSYVCIDGSYAWRARKHGMIEFQQSSGQILTQMILSLS